MFITTMQVGEEILAGDNIRIVVMRTERGHVKLGFDAPKEVKFVKKMGIIPEKYSRGAGPDNGKDPGKEVTDDNRIQDGREDKLKRHYGVRPR